MMADQKAALKACTMVHQKAAYWAACLAPRRADNRVAAWGGLRAAIMVDLTASRKVELWVALSDVL